MFRLTHADAVLLYSMQLGAAFNQYIVEMRVNPESISTPHVLSYNGLNLGNAPDSLQHLLHAGERTDGVGQLPTSARKTMGGGGGRTSVRLLCLCLGPQ